MSQPSVLDDAVARATELEARAGSLVRTVAARRRGSGLPLRSLRVLAVLDDMSRASFAPECELTCPAPGEWRELLEPGAFDLLLVESAWRGNGDSWRYEVGSYAYEHTRHLRELTALVERCRATGVPTVFWNKEDPVHFDRFRQAAALFDHVMTSDANCIEAYRALDAPHQRSVGALAFAAQPRLHNPLPVVEERDRRPCFAGTYYRNRHEERQGGLDMLLDAALPYGLDIFDRMHGSGDPDFGFPERFAAHVRGCLPYGAIVEEYKRRRLFLNVNSVLASPTMLSRRVFELLACDTSVLSTPSVGVEAMFGELVPVARTPEQAAETLQALLGDEPARRAAARAGRRHVLSRHTYSVRLASIAAAAGIDVRADADADRGVAVLVVLDGDEAGGQVTELAAALSAQTSPPASVLVALPRDAEAVAEPLVARGAVALEHEPGSRQERLRELAARAGLPWAAPVRVGAPPSPTALEDLVNCTRFADADVLGAPTEGAELRPCDAVDPDRALARTSVLTHHGWPETPAGFAGWTAAGVRIHAADALP